MNEEALSLSVSTRSAEENPKSIRRAGDVPGIIYGAKTKSVVVKCKRKELHTVYVEAGENKLVEVQIDDKKIPCLIHAVSFDPVSDREEHVDFYAVDRTKKVTTRVPVVVTGESPAVKTEGGVLVTVHDEIEVTCLPHDIPAQFIVAIGVLQKFHDSITVGELRVPKGVTIKSPADMVIITVQEPRKEEVIEVVAPVATEGEAAATAAAPGVEGAAAASAAKAEDKAGGKEKATKN